VPSRLSKLSAKLLRTCCLAILVSTFAFAANPGAATPPILPKEFARWQLQGAPQASKDAAAADPANAALLKEYGFTDVESAAYKSDDGRTLKIRAARFADASGAFGAYMFYVQPEMARKKLATRAHRSTSASYFTAATFWWMPCSASFQSCRGRICGSWPVFCRIRGKCRKPFLQFLLSCHITAISRIQRKYAEGPLGLAAIAAPLPAELVDFSASPEVVLGQYSTPGGDATLMLIEYPTPALAAEHLRRIDAAHHAAQPQPGVTAVENVGPFFDKRTGPIVAIAAGSLSQSDAQTLLGAVNWDASVTWEREYVL